MTFQMMNLISFICWEYWPIQLFQEVANVFKGLVLRFARSRGRSAIQPRIV